MRHPFRVPAVLLACAGLLASGAAPALQLAGNVRIVNSGNEAVPVVIAGASTPTPVQASGFFKAAVQIPKSIYTVPAGKRLVIEFVSFRGYSPNPGETCGLLVQATVAGSSTPFYFACGSTTGNLFHGSAPARILADGGTDLLAVGDFVPRANGFNSIELSFTGYLVDAP